MAKIKPILFQDMNQGGLADSKWSGSSNSAYKLVGIDLHSTPGLNKIHQKLTKDSASVVDEMCKTVVEASTGEIYFFSSDSGKIWKVGSPYTLAHTTTPDEGEAKCLGAREFDGYIYWFTEKRAHRIPVSGLSNWSANAEEDWAPLNLDQAAIGGTGNTYSLTNALNEGATHLQTFTPVNSPIESIGVNIGAKGTADWTLKIHDSSDVEVASSVVVTASLPASGFHVFDLAALFYPVKGSTYHIHIYGDAASGTVVSGVASDLEGGNMKIYTTSDSEFHPTEIQNQNLYVGDKNFLHEITVVVADGSHVFTREALDIQNPLRVKSLGLIGIDILLGTTVSSSLAKSQVIRWNTWSDSFTSTDEIDEVGINAFFKTDNFVMVNAGEQGNLYVYDGQQLELFSRIPGDYSSTKYGSVHPNAVANLNGKVLFGFSNGSGNPAEQGVYTLGRYGRKYDLVMDLSYPISERDTGAFVMSGIEIGCLLVSGFDLYVMWKNGSTYGVDKLDYTAKLDGAYIETRVAIIEREISQNLSEWIVPYVSLPTSTQIAVAYDKNYTGTYTAFTTDELRTDADRMIKKADLVVEATAIQVKMTFTTNVNDAPETRGLIINPSEV